jgi:Rrf2 family protein
MADAFRVSEAAGIGLHAVVVLLQNPGRAISTQVIARALNCSEAHLSKVMQRLAKAGVVKSARGPHGGFLLAVEEKKLNLLTVFESIDGPLGGGGCLLNPAQCDGTTCILGSLSVEVNQLVRKSLAGISVKDLKTRKVIALEPGS